MKEIKLRASANYGFDKSVELRLFDFEKRQVATGITLSTDHEDGTWVKPFLTLDVTQAQGLMDDLWSCGLRPTEGSGSAGSREATQAHLKDLRAITWHALGIGAIQNPRGIN
jgi:hypothetical protein